MSKLDTNPGTVHLKMVHYRSESWKVAKHGMFDKYQCENTCVSVNTGVGPFSLNHVFPDFKRDE